MAKTFDDFIQEQLQDPEFREEYEALQPERAIIQAIIDARQQSGNTQKELSERTGIAHGNISKMERENANPSSQYTAETCSWNGDDPQTGIPAKARTPNVWVRNL